MIQILFFIKLESIILKLNIIPKAIEKYMSFAIQQPEKKGIKPGLPLVFIDSVHVLNNSLDNLVEHLGKNDFYHLNQEFSTNMLICLRKKDFFSMIIGIVLKNSKKDYPTKISFIIH